MHLNYYDRVERIQKCTPTIFRDNRTCPGTHLVKFQRPEVQKSGNSNFRKILQIDWNLGISLSLICDIRILYYHGLKMLNIANICENSKISDIFRCYTYAFGSLYLFGSSRVLLSLNVLDRVWITLSHRIKIRIEAGWAGL